MWKKVVLVALALASGTIFIGTTARLIGQDKKVKGRLPPYYSQIVTEQQREAIYVIQAKYRGQITALQEQMEKLDKQQDLDIENVLSPQQKMLLAKLLEDAAAKKRKSADDKIAVKLAEAEAAKAAADAKAQPAEGKKGRVKKDK